MGLISWEERGARARDGLGALQFLVGEWTGEGHSHGEPVVGRLKVWSCFGDTFLEARETLTTPSGELEHEDACFYRYDPESRVIKVTQHMAHAWTSESLVSPEPWGARWYSGPFSPRVELRPDGPDVLVESVFDPEETEPSLRVVWRRV